MDIGSWHSMAVFMFLYICIGLVLLVTAVYLQIVYELKNEDWAKCVDWRTTSIWHKSAIEMLGERMHATQ